MLALFPQILFLAPVGTALLRVVVACYFLYIAWFLITTREEIRRTPLPFVGFLSAPVVWFGACAFAALAMLLILGIWTQAVAFVGALGMLKHGFYARRYSAILPFSRSTYILLLSICLSLVVSGAGAFAFDLPL